MHGAAWMRTTANRWRLRIETDRARPRLDGFGGLVQPMGYCAALPPRRMSPIRAVRLSGTVAAASCANAYNE